jgi:hypothetical protein
MSRHRAVSLVATGMVVAAAALTVRAFQQDPNPGVVVRGRIIDPPGLRTPTTLLMAWHQLRPYSGAGEPVTLAADGTFVTRALRPGTYAFEALRSSSASSAADVLGLEIVEVGVAKDVTIRLRPASQLTGHYRMESDDPKAAWPVDMNVMANIAVDGLEITTSGVTEGAPGGRFVLRNAFGPRVLKFGYRVPTGPTWWPSRVLLDGRDVTNVPTDFSEHPDARLEVVFTQRPARIVGLVTDSDGRPVPQAWVAAIGTDPAAVQPWSTTARAVRANDRGQYSIVMPPGDYRVHALPADAWPTHEVARPALATISFGGVKVTAKDRTFIRTDLTLQAR